MSMNLTMGGYGWYVWPAYAITFFVFALNFWLTTKEKKIVSQTIKRVVSRHRKD